jgi:hypothetical protein
MEDIFKIIVNVDEAQRFNSGRVKCVIYCQFGTTFFPDDLWDDFAVIILEWWTQAALRLLIQSSDYEELLFMDGSFQMDAQLKEAGKCEITYFNRYEKERPVFTASIDNLVSEVIKASEKVINKCKLEKWDSDDLTSLISSCNNLNKIFAQVKAQQKL